MFLPIGDTPNPPRSFTPWVNWALLASNIAVFLLISLPLMGEPAQLAADGAREYVRVLGAQPRTLYDVYVFQNGFKPGAFEVADLFYSMFLHGGFMHLAGNMLFLWIYGDNVEFYLGRVRYLLVYLATGVVATLTFAAFAPGSLTPLVGASGAISGVLGLYFLFFPRNRIKVFIFLFPFIMNVFLVPARVVLGFYLVIDNLFPALLGAQSGVAHGAHIGGFVAGLGLAWIIERRGGLSAGPARGTPRPSAGPREVTTRAGDPFEALRDALEAQKARRAVDLAMQLGPGELSALPVTETVQLARYLNDAGQWAPSAHLLRRALADNQTNPRALAEVYLTLGLIRLENGQPTAAYQHLLTALDLAPGTSTADRAREALGKIAPERTRPS